MAAARVLWDRDLVLEQSCRLCHRPEFVDARKAWGCDGDAPSPIFTLQCWDCAPRADKSCTRCSGTGRVEWRQCPNKSIDPAALQVARQVDIFIATGALPRAGGVDDQHGTFAQVLWLMLGEHGRYASMRGQKPAPEPRHDSQPAMDPFGYLRTPGA